MTHDARYRHTGDAQACYESSRPRPASLGAEVAGLYPASDRWRALTNPGASFLFPSLSAMRLN